MIIPTAISMCFESYWNLLAMYGAYQYIERAINIDLSLIPCTNSVR